MGYIQLFPPTLLIVSAAPKSTHSLCTVLAQTNTRSFHLRFEDLTKNTFGRAQNTHHSIRHIATEAFKLHKETEPIQTLTRLFVPLNVMIFGRAMVYTLPIEHTKRHYLIWQWSNTSLAWRCLRSGECGRKGWMTSEQTASLKTRPSSITIFGTGISRPGE